MPSCYESFWLDELHSAWTIWGNLSDVAPRADAGHQSPLYFFALWFWKQPFGGSELALRMSSVIATSLACVALTIGITKWTQNLVAGVTSGLILAIESNAIFFGTELRPYSFILLVATIALTCFLLLLDSRSRFDRPGLWVLLNLMVLLAALIQPTSIGVLVFFPIVLLVHWARHNIRELTRLGALDGVLLFSAATTIFALWRMTLGESWQDRAQWAAFGSATKVRQMLEIWDWLWMLGIPLAVASVAVMISLRSETPAAMLRLYRTVVGVSLLAITATCLFWILARCEFVPIWHRRYMVAVLPILACVPGGAVGMISKWTVLRGRNEVLITSAAGFVMITGLGLHQGTIQALPNYPVALAVRGEGWREAIDWVRNRAGSEDRILLDPGLIESDILFQADSQNSAHGNRSAGATLQRSAGATLQQRVSPSSDYLLFPVGGPYSVDWPVELRSLESPIHLRSGNPSTNGESAFQGRRIFIVRRPATGLKSVQQEAVEMVPFGGVTVIVRTGALENRD